MQSCRCLTSLLHRRVTMGRSRASCSCSRTQEWVLRIRHGRHTTLHLKLHQASPPRCCGHRRRRRRRRRCRRPLVNARQNRSVSAQDAARSCWPRTAFAGGAALVWTVVNRRRFEFGCAFSWCLFSKPVPHEVDPKNLGIKPRHCMNGDRDWAPCPRCRKVSKHRPIELGRWFTRLVLGGVHARVCSL